MKSDTIENQPALAAVFEQAKANKNAPRPFRPTEVGQWVRQGDFAIAFAGHTMEEARKQLPAGSLTTPRVSPQIAEGTSTGSRHVMEGDFKLFETAEKGVLHGPVIVVNGDASLTHPEHGHILFLTPGVYTSMAQKNCAIEEDTRVRD